jgi:serine/threonine protein kinase
MIDYYLKYLKYKSKYLKLKGGEEIGKGKFGLVFRPPLICQPIKEVYQSSDYVGKIMTEEDAEKELINSNKVRELDPTCEWSITTEYKSFYQEEQTDSDYKKDYNTKYPVQLISKFGGETIKKIIKWNEEKPKELDISKIPLFIQLVKQAVPIIKDLNKTYAHNDLHLDNIMYDVKDGKIRLIDFGELTPINDKCDFEEFYYSIKSVIYVVKNNFGETFIEWLKNKPTNCKEFEEAILSLPVLA